MTTLFNKLMSNHSVTYDQLQQQLNLIFIHIFMFLPSDGHTGDRSDALWATCCSATNSVSLMGCSNLSLLANCDSFSFSTIFSDDNRLGHFEVVSGPHVVLRPPF